MRGCLDTLVRCEDLLTAIEAAPRRISRDLALRVGPHFRHIVDHFGCFFQGLAHRHVDYDERARDTRLERDPERIRGALRETRHGLAQLGADAGLGAIDVHQRVCDDEAVTVASTLDRELAFLSSHTIHHISIIVRVATASGLVINPDLELAFSTAAHRRTFVSTENLCDPCAP